MLMMNRFNGIPAILQALDNKHWVECQDEYSKPAQAA